MALTSAVNTINTKEQARLLAATLLRERYCGIDKRRYNRANAVVEKLDAEEFFDSSEYGVKDSDFISCGGGF